jgi:uncharacterized membrane protein
MIYLTASAIVALSAFLGWIFTTTSKTSGLSVEIEIKAFGGGIKFKTTKDKQ